VSWARGTGRRLALFALPALLSGAAACGRTPPGDQAPAAVVQAPEPLALQSFDFGGDFELPAHTGQAFRLADYRGKAVLLFFGYTYCPDVCPTTLATMARVETLLGSDRERLQTVFVSVDPERDTPQRLAEYVANFKAHAIAATGTKAQVDALVGRYAAFYEKQASDSAMGYMVDHTSRLYLIDPHGKVRYLFRYGEDAETIAKGVRLALAE
jgi:protein SCO1/2